APEVTQPTHIHLSAEPDEALHRIVLVVARADAVGCILVRVVQRRLGREALAHGCVALEGETDARDAVAGRHRTHLRVRQRQAHVGALARARDRDVGVPAGAGVEEVADVVRLRDPRLLWSRELVDEPSVETRAPALVREVVHATTLAVHPAELAVEALAVQVLIAG